MPNKPARMFQAERRFTGRPRLPTRLAWLGLGLMVAIFFADGLIISTERAASISDFTTATANLANGMAAQTARSLVATDVVLLELRGVLEPQAPRPSGAPGFNSEAAAGNLTELRRRASGIEALAVVDAQGRIVRSSRATRQPAADVSGQPYFRHFADAGGSGADALFVGAPQRDAASGHWVSVMARHCIGPQARFDGVVTAEISLDDLEDFYRNAMPQHRTVTLSRADGVVLVRYPHQDHATGHLIPPGAAWRAAALAGGGSYVAPDILDAEPVVAVVRPLRGLPLIIETSVSEAAALAGWQRQLRWLILGGVVACVGVIMLLCLFGWQIQRLAMKNRQLDEARGRLDAAMSNMSQGLCFFDGGLRLIVCNRRYREMYGLPERVTQPGVSLREVVEHCYAAGGTTDFSAEDYLRTREIIARTGEPHHSVITMADGRTIAIQQQPMPDGGWVATHEDITERRRAEEKINFMARHDVLTGLPNRSLLLERLGQARCGATRGAGLAVQFLDLDRFKAVNDTLGHAAGDELLRSVAARLLATVRDGDTVARLGGDEFVVLQANLSSAEAAAVLAERIIRTVAAPYVIGGNEVIIGVSIGIDVVVGDPAPADVLLANADKALYTAKKAGRGTFRFFEVDMDAEVQTRHALARGLRCALARGEFELHYQPVLGAASGRTCCFEALLRWNHPVRGRILPDHFIGVAEECGLIIELGEWVIGEACREAVNWPEEIHVAVNLSPVQFRAANLVDVVKQALAAAGVAAVRLELEITETVLLQGVERNIAVLQQLRDLGVGIVMDDFGRGQSSLSHLRRFAFDRIKIDQSFVGDLTTHTDTVYFVRALVGLCAQLGIRTTAAGVETAEQLGILVAEGCTELQGHLFSRPRPAGQLVTLAGGARLIAAGLFDAGVVPTD